MKIVVLTGSPNKNGASNFLADKFCQGAAGNEIARFDTAFADVGFCRACNFCKTHDGQCVLKDGFAEIRAAVENCDLLVIVSPVYWMDFSAQLKKTLDRFHAFGRNLRGKNAKTMLIAVSADERPSAKELIQLHFEKITDYIRWQNCGELFALGVPDRETLLQTDFPEKAFAMGASCKNL